MSWLSRAGGNVAGGAAVTEPVTWTWEENTGPGPPGGASEPGVLFPPTPLAPHEPTRAPGWTAAAPVLRRRGQRPPTTSGRCESSLTCARASAAPPECAASEVETERIPEPGEGGSTVGQRPAAQAKKQALCRCFLLPREMHNCTDPMKQKFPRGGKTT